MERTKVLSDFLVLLNLPNPELQSPTSAVLTDLLFLKEEKRGKRGEKKTQKNREKGGKREKKDKMETKNEEEEGGKAGHF